VKVLQGKKGQCDVRKILDKKNYGGVVVPVPDLLPVPQLPGGARWWGVVLQMYILHIVEP